MSPLTERRADRIIRVSGSDNHMPGDPRNYWLDCFTGTTWNEFRTSGSRVSGFRASQRNHAGKIQPGDLFLCYLVGVMRWVGALRVVGPSNDTSMIWKDADFPVRFAVEPVIVLDPEHGVPMGDLQGKVTFYETEKDKGGFKGFVRRSPNRFQVSNDAKRILELLREAERSPVHRPVDPKKLAAKPYFQAEKRKGKTTVPLLVSVPEPEERLENDDEGAPRSLPESASTRHVEVQYMLLSLAADMGLDVWVARNDRGRAYNGRQLAEIPNLLDKLPTQFNEATNRTIELIDVLWLKGNSIVSAFEIECTTSIYSGLLRMSDLLALQPNLEIKLYLAAPDDRRTKFQQEIQRPTFELRDKPLSTVCGFLPFSHLTEKIDGIRKLGLARSLKPDFLQETAEYFHTEDL